MLKTAHRGGRPKSFSDEQVFRAITELVVVAGISAVSMPAIARRIGCSHQAVTQRFSNRESMLRAYGGWYLDNLTMAEERYRTSNEPSLSGLIDFFSGGVVDEMLGVPGLGGPAEPIKLMLEFDRVPVLREVFKPSRQQTTAWITEQIEQAQREGDIEPTCDPLDVAETLLFSVSGAVVLHAFSDPAFVRQRMQRAIDLALKPYRVVRSD